MKIGLIKQITLSGMFLGLAIIVGAFGNFNIFGGSLNIIGIVIFVLPFFLKIQFSVITTALSVSIVDVIHSWGFATYISIIAYVGALLIMYLSKIIKLKIMYFVFLLISALWVIFIYYILERLVIGQDFAIKDIISTSIEMGAVVVSCLFLYIPMRIISKLI